MDQLSNAAVITRMTTKTRMPGPLQHSHRFYGKGVCREATKTGKSRRLKGISRHHAGDFFPEKEPRAQNQVA